MCKPVHTEERAQFVTGYIKAALYHGKCSRGPHNLKTRISNLYGVMDVDSFTFDTMLDDCDLFIRSAMNVIGRAIEKSIVNAHRSGANVLQKNWQHAGACFFTSRQGMAGYEASWPDPLAGKLHKAASLFPSLELYVTSEKLVVSSIPGGVPSERQLSSALGVSP